MGGVLVVHVIGEGCPPLFDIASCFPLVFVLLLFKTSLVLSLSVLYIFTSHH